MTFFIDQHGCAKNQVDGEEILARMEAAGHRYVTSGDMADLIIVNTCGFIEKAKKESLDAVMAIRSTRPGKRILVAGCLSQRYPKELLADLEEADGFVGNADLGAVVDAAERALSGRRECTAAAQPTAMPSSHYRRTRLFDYPGTAHIKVTEGCDNRCSFCAIPIIRGSLRSRSLEDILSEFQELVEAGRKEIVLIGQDLGSYGKDLKGLSAVSPGASSARVRSGLGVLLDSISSLNGNFRVRVLYIHPDNFPLDILDAIEKDPRLLPYFDIPFQHASDSLLRAMNRRGSYASYLELAKTIRDRLPETMIRTTFLVGFPGETEADFAAVQRFQAELQPDWMGAFSYSREEGTPAWNRKDRVPKKIASRRLDALMEAQQSISAARLSRFVGSECDVLVEESVEGTNFSIGRAWMQAPEVDGLVVLDSPREPGAMVRARIKRVNGFDLEAEVLGEASDKATRTTAFDAVGLPARDGR